MSVYTGGNVTPATWRKASRTVIRDDARRTLLFDMDMSIRQLATDHPGHKSVVGLTNAYHNLLRQWAEV